MPSSSSTIATLIGISSASLALTRLLWSQRAAPAQPHECAANPGPAQAGKLTLSLTVVPLPGDALHRQGSPHVSRPAGACCPAHAACPASAGRAWLSNPRPSSCTTISSACAEAFACTRTSRAWLCLSALVSASLTTRKMLWRISGGSERVGRSCGRSSRQRALVAFKQLVGKVRDVFHQALQRVAAGPQRPNDLFQRPHGLAGRLRDLLRVGLHLARIVLVRPGQVAQQGDARQRGAEVVVQVLRDARALALQRALLLDLLEPALVFASFHDAGRRPPPSPAVPATPAQ